MKTHPFTLLSATDMSFLCAPCGKTIFNIDTHFCSEQTDEMVRQATALMADIERIGIIYPPK